jgi:two-component system KDP operon response regulator KdpE
LTSDNSPSVLIVDDDPAIGRLLRVLLESQNVRVRVAPNGAKALEALAEFLPDLVLLDLQMPVMDGRTFYRQFRDRGHAVPVILLSAYSVEAAQEELGADGAITKPFDPIRVGVEISRILEQSRK